MHDEQRRKEIISIISEHPHERVKVAITDIDGVLRGKYLHRDKFLASLSSGFGFCDVVFGWDIADSGYDNADFTGWHTGFPDATARIDLATFRQIPWENGIPFVLGDFADDQTNSKAVCPRALLKRIREQAKQAGYCASYSQEFEWFNFRENIDDLHERGFHQPRPITPGMFGYSLLRLSKHGDYVGDLFDLMCKYGIPIEGFHAETGPGVLEAAILYADILEAADRAVLFKAGVKEIAAAYDIIPSFMAKWNEQLPGCSGHVHQSLWSADGSSNLFHDAAASDGMSALMRQFLAGQLYCLPHILPMIAPTINSYKRLVEGAWAPTTVTWSYDNRTTAFRVLSASSKSCRIEHRVVGSDSNPYLAMAACLASGLYGIRKQLSLDTLPTQGSGYRNTTAAPLARTLEEATRIMAQSELAVELFGTDFVRHFVQTRQWECRQYNKSVTDWERKRYFEIV